MADRLQFGLYVVDFACDQTTVDDGNVLFPWSRAGMSFVTTLLDDAPPPTAGGDSYKATNLQGHTRAKDKSLKIYYT